MVWNLTKDLVVVAVVAAGVATLVTLTGSWLGFESRVAPAVAAAVASSLVVRQRRCARECAETAASHS